MITHCQVARNSASGEASIAVCAVSTAVPDLVVCPSLYALPLRCQVSVIFRDIWSVFVLQWISSNSFSICHSLTKSRQVSFKGHANRVCQPSLQATSRQRWQLALQYVNISPACRAGKPSWHFRKDSCRVHHRAGHWESFPAGVSKGLNS